MRTSELIALLAAAPPPRRRWEPSRRLAAAGLAAGCLACTGFLVVCGPRPDLMTALADPCVVFKFVFAAGCLAAGFLICRRAMNPQRAPSPWPLAIPLALVLCGTAAELALTPSSHWEGAMVGVTPWNCVLMIILSSMVPAVAILGALRGGAPRSPTWAGAAGGLLAGAIGSGIFALSCPNDSALFVSVWYVGTVVALALAGAVAGRRILAW